MQKNQFFILALLSIFLINCTQKGGRVIENPEYGLRNTNTIEITKVELTDTTTIMHFNVLSRGGWVHIDPAVYHLVADGKTYTIERAEGITLGEQYFFPEIGEDGINKIVLYFQPVPLSTKSMDFVGTGCETCWNIWDINVANKKRRFSPNIPTDILNFKADKNTTLPDPKMEIGNTKVTLHLSGMRDDFLLRGVNMYVNNIFTLEQEDVAGKEVEQGVYTFEFEQFGSANAAIVISSQAGLNMFVNALLSPGETAELFFDMNAFSKATDRLNPQPNIIYAGFRGKFAQINNQMLRLSSEDRNLFSINVWEKPEILTMSAQEYFDFLKNIHNENLEQIEKLNASEGVKQMLATDLNASLVNNILTMERMLPNVYRQQHKLSWNSPIDYVAPTAEQSDIITAIKNLDLNNPKNLYSSSFGFRVVQPVLFFLPENINEITGSISGLLQDLQKAQPLIRKASTLVELSEEEKSTLNSTSLPIYLQVFNRIADNSRRQMEEAMQKGGFEIAETPNVSNDKVLETIIAKYKGKALLIDFWATWCGPCITAFRQMKPLKAEMMEKSVTMVYISNPSSPKARWASMLPDIGGIHYYLTEEQWQVVSNQYKIQGIPTYMIFDKNGTKTFETAGYPGNDKMREELAKVW